MSTANLSIHLYRDQTEYKKTPPVYISGCYSIGIWTAGGARKLPDNFPSAEIISVGGKIYPGFRHHPNKLDIILDVIAVYEHYNMDSKKFYESCKYILTHLELETLDYRTGRRPKSNTNAALNKLEAGIDSLNDILSKHVDNYLLVDDNFEQALLDELKVV